MRRQTYSYLPSQKASSQSQPPNGFQHCKYSERPFLTLQSCWTFCSWKIHDGNFGEAMPLIKSSYGYICHWWVGCHIRTVMRSLQGGLVLRPAPFSLTQYPAVWNFLQRIWFLEPPSSNDPIWSGSRWKVYTGFYLRYYSRYWKRLIVSLWQQHCLWAQSDRVRIAWYLSTINKSKGLESDRAIDIYPMSFIVNSSVHTIHRSPRPLQTVYLNYDALGNS